MNEPKRLTITNLNWPDKSVKENTEWVSNEDYLLLKAENERIRKLFADTERLMLLDGEYEAAKVGTYASHKAEVEKLETEVASIGSEYMAATRHYNLLCNNLKAEVERLKAQVEAQAQRCADYEDLVQHYKHQRDEAYNESFDWQPIETAPKDGTWVLLATNNPDPISGIPDLDIWFPYVGLGRYIADTDYDDRGWMRCSEYSVNFEPTHWMPLPKPPIK